MSGHSDILSKQSRYLRFWELLRETRLTLFGRALSNNGHMSVSTPHACKSHMYLLYTQKAAQQQKLLKVSLTSIRSGASPTPSRQVGT